MQITISRAPGAAALREDFIANIRYIPGIGLANAKRIQDGETLTITLPEEKRDIALANLASLAAKGYITTTGTSEITAPQPVSLDGLDDDEAALVRRILEKKGISEARVIELIEKHGARPAHVSIDLTTKHEVVPTYTGLMHHRFPLLLAAVAQCVNIMLVGPAGSGKTTAAVHAAQALGLPFYGTGALDNGYKLTGFIDAQGRIVSTAFRQAFEHGGVFLFDEMDASLPSALLAFNAALANDWMDFPDKNVKRHPDFRVIAGANTFGTGADRQYVGRNQLDAASLDRYAVLEWGYDEALEAALIGAPAPKGSPVPPSIAPLLDDTATIKAHAFFDRVRKVRGAVNELKVRHVVSPRATVNGGRLLAAGWQWNDVEDAVIWKGLDADTRAKVEAKAA